MDVLTALMVLAVIASAALAVTGWWRLVFAPFRIKPAAMTVRKLGLFVREPKKIERVDTILRSFAGGFNAMLTGRTQQAWRRYCEALPVLFQPFAHEGVAMGFTVRRLGRFQPEIFERELVKARPQMRYLYYVGLGFWSGMRHHGVARLGRLVERLDPLHRYLCYDGYGFKYAFFDYPKDRGAFDRFEELPGYGRNAAYQGVGRAFFFRYMDDPRMLIERIASLGPYAGDAAAGVGLASTFVFPDRLEIAQRIGRQLPAEWHSSFHLGMCFALKARSINDVDRSERDLALAPRETSEAARAAIRECDRIELLERAEGGADGYRNWRNRVAGWMTEHIEYPLIRLQSVARVGATERQSDGALQARKHEGTKA